MKPKTNTWYRTREGGVAFLHIEKDEQELYREGPIFYGFVRKGDPWFWLHGTPEPRSEAWDVYGCIYGPGVEHPDDLIRELTEAEIPDDIDMESRKQLALELSRPYRP